MHRCEQQHGQPLGRRRGEQQAGQFGVVGDAGREIGVQRGVCRLGKVGEELLTGGDRAIVAG